MAVEYERMMGAIEYGAPTEMVERRMVSVAVDDLGPPLVCAARCGRADVIALLRARGAKCPPEAMIVAITEDNAAVIAAAKDDFEDLHPFFLMAVQLHKPHAARLLRTLVDDIEFEFDMEDQRFCADWKKTMSERKLVDAIRRALAKIRVTGTKRKHST